MASIHDTGRIDRLVRHQERKVIRMLRIERIKRIDRWCDVARSPGQASIEVPLFLGRVTATVVLNRCSMDSRVFLLILQSSIADLIRRTVAQSMPATIRCVRFNPQHGVPRRYREEVVM